MLIPSTYPGPRWYEAGGHLQTILPALRAAAPCAYRRERIPTPDDDFLDLDWLQTTDPPDPDTPLIILSHGLEGSSDRAYIRAIATHVHQRGYDVLAWNSRSCGGEMNRTARLYNHGQSEDLATVAEYAHYEVGYRRIILAGFSMGGNLTLKYLGTLDRHRPVPITHGLAFSAPCFIRPSALALDRWENRLYKRKFFQALRDKILQKETTHPGIIDPANFARVRRWEDFDTHFSAPLSGFTTAQEFYDYASAAHFMADIRTPTLLVNALNDPIVPPACTPVDLCAAHDYIHLEQPRQGGHVGFSLPGSAAGWQAERILEFVGRRE
ncbi:MAG: alpha/beta fold hydrolase [Saprospiraceae bacterium]